MSDGAATPSSEPPSRDSGATESTLYGHPFEERSFGAEFVWAEGDAFIAKVLRVRQDEKVRVTAQNRRDMSLMLTGGRACLEVARGDEVMDTIELEPAAPVRIHAELGYRLIAMTDVELFTIYTQL